MRLTVTATKTAVSREPSIALKLYCKERDRNGKVISDKPTFIKQYQYVCSARKSHRQ